MEEYRILKYYFAFFGRNAYKLQKREKFLWWKWWYTITEDKLGVNYNKWREKFDCPIIDSGETE